METYHYSSDRNCHFLLSVPWMSVFRAESDSLGFLQDKLQPQWEVGEEMAPLRAPVQQLPHQDSGSASWSSLSRVPRLELYLFWGCGGLNTNGPIDSYI